MGRVHPVGGCRYARAGGSGCGVGCNESGGADGSKRFEPEVYGHLVRVQVGMETYYGSLKRADLRNLSDEALRGLATSWGPTQIMGYNAIAHGVDYLALDTPPVSMELTVKIILDDARRFRLDPSKDFGALLKCWNTGGPSGKTFDPLYVLKGMQRLRLYAEV